MSFSLRYGIERVLAVATAAACALTAVWPGWIEAISGLDPDHGSGGAEWVVCAILGVTAVVCGLAAKADHRRLTSAATS